MFRLEKDAPGMLRSVDYRNKIAKDLGFGKHDSPYKEYLAEVNRKDSVRVDFLPLILERVDDVLDAELIQLATQVITEARVRKEKKQGSGLGPDVRRRFETMLLMEGMPPAGTFYNGIRIKSQKAHGLQVALEDQSVQEALETIISRYKANTKHWMQKMLEGEVTVEELEQAASLILRPVDQE